MLPSQITAHHLRSIAGSTYVRGEAYWREGRVAACAADESSIEGVVNGSSTYHVRVVSHGRDLYASCTCPVGDGMCKHAVALVLHYLGQRNEACLGVSFADPRGRRAELPPPEPIAGAFATRGELEAFAAEHRVKHALLVSAEVLAVELTFPPQDYWLKTVLARLPIRDVGALDVAARQARARGIDVAIAKAAYRVMHRAAETVRVGLEEEARRGACPDAQLATLWNRLVELRAVIRRAAYPRDRGVREAGSWSGGGRDAAITWKEQARVFRQSTYSTTALVTRLAFPSGAAAELTCTCDARDAHCTHALALIDATLDFLEDPTRATEAIGLAELLLRPGWARVLSELDRLETGDAPRIASEITWQINDDLSDLGLVPIVKKFTRRGLSKGARAKPADLLDEQLPDQDRRIAEQLDAWAPSTRSTYPARAFAALAGHPRIVDGDGEPVELVRVALGFNALPVGENVTLEPALEGARFDPRLLAALLDVFAPGEPLFVADVAGRERDGPERRRHRLVDVSDEARRLWNLLQQHGETFPPESHAQLLDRLGKLEPKLPVSIPRELKGRELSAKPVTVVRVRLLPDISMELELFVRPAPGTPLFPPGHGPRDVLVQRDGERGYVRRDLTGELDQARSLFQILPVAGAVEGPPLCFVIDDPDRALEIVAALQDPPAGIEAQWVDAKQFVRGAATADQLRVKVERRRDWFGITGDLKIEGGRLELAILLDAARRQQRFVRVDPNRWIELTQALQERLLAISDQAYMTRDHVELSPGAAPAIRALALAGAKVDAVAAWEQLTDRLAASKRLRPKPPATLRATLRDYQVEGHAWLSRLAAWGTGACLADDMGLGKTVQAIALLLDRAKLGPALVLAPTSVSYNWVDELRRFGPTLNPILYTEPNRNDRAAGLAKLGKRDVVIASYGLLVNDADKLAATKFATLVVDEAQALKNPSTRRARAARTLDADFRVALSGTPFENHLGELWSLYSVIFPGLLGSWDQFRDRYAVPIERDKNPEARAALSRVLRPFLLRRTKQEVARELPARTEIEVPVALSEAERALYEDARLAAVAELATTAGGGKEAGGMQDQRRRFQVLAALTRLRLLASHPKLYDGTSNVPSSKLARAVELLEELRAEGHRALVFSQFTSHLALVRAALAERGFSQLYLDGSTPAGQRGQLVRTFQEGTGEVFLISLKAGGQGINLTAADYIVHLDPWWNPAVEDQATDRAHRIGQTKPVTVYRLIARGTIEEQILSLHKEKRALVAGILEGSDVAARMTTRDLMALLQAPTR